MMTLARNEFKLTFEILKKLKNQPQVVFGSLRLELEQEIPINTVFVYDTVLRIVRAREGDERTHEKAIGYVSNLLEEAHSEQAEIFFNELPST